MRPAAVVVRDRVTVVLREHGLLSTAQVGRLAGWVLESELHTPPYKNAVVGFLHTFRPDHPTVRVLACDGVRCLVSRNLTSGQLVLRTLNGLAKQNIVVKVKTPGVQACYWYLRQPEPSADLALEALWNLPARHG